VFAAGSTVTCCTLPMRVPPATVTRFVVVISAALASVTWTQISRVRLGEAAALGMVNVTLPLP